ncbi:MAG TPA: hypothetical protein VMU30_02650, partial [Bacteroidota bacterium]|nr:hypothetical protein [Bacteroidota bacterium]
ETRRMNALLKSVVQQWKIIAATAVILVLATAVFHVLHQKELPLLPPSILRLTLTHEIHGEAARQQMNALHGRNVTPEENEIGIYGSPDGSGTLYISLYGSAKEAAVAYDSMKTAIAKDHSTFTHFRTIETGGQQYEMCMGNGSAHYFFVHNDTLYWWSVDIPVAQASFRDLFKRVQTRL